MKIYGRYLKPYTTLTGVLFSLYFFCLRSEITTLTSAIDHINSTTNCQKFIKYPITKTSFPDGISVVFFHPLGLTVVLVRLNKDEFLSFFQNMLFRFSVVHHLARNTSVQ